VPSVSEDNACIPRHIDYVISVASPWTYLGHARFCQIVRRYGIGVRILPVDMVDVFNRTGGTVFRDRAIERRAYRQIELRRWSGSLAIPLTLEPAHYPVAHEPASRLILAAADMGHDVLALTGRILAAVWRHERDIADETTLFELAAVDIADPRALLAHAALLDIEAAYIAATDEAVAKGVFGAPTYILENELFWGQDRLAFLEETLQNTTQPR